MNKEKNFETYVFIEKNKFKIFLFDKIKLKNLYKEEISFKDDYEIDVKKLNKFLDDNIFKIEKLINQFIQNIYLILEHKKELEEIEKKHQLKIDDLHDEKRKELVSLPTSILLPCQKFLHCGGYHLTSASWAMNVLTLWQKKLRGTLAGLFDNPGGSRTMGIGRKRYSKT